jgi:hypothetical protein
MTVVEGESTSVGQETAGEQAVAHQALLCVYVRVSVCMRIFIRVRALHT